jgi:ribosomal protein S18 acetylase RimI-like enzyme
MNYRIRCSEISDTEILGQVHARASHETYTDVVPADALAKMGSVEWRSGIRRGMFERSTPDWGHFLVESAAREVMGFGDCGPAYKPDITLFAPLEIYTLYLLRAAQGHGLGGALLKHMLAHAASRGFEKAALSVLANNESALGFYRHMGGTEVSRSDSDLTGTKLPTAIYLWTGLKKPT